MLPAGAVVLAHNDMSLQAAAFTCRRGTFWGVQYHPEYDPIDIGAVAERYGMRLVEEKIFDDEAALHEFAADMRPLAVDPKPACAGVGSWASGPESPMRRRDCWKSVTG